MLDGRARLNILRAAENRVISAAQRSSFIQVSPINERAGWPPEEYLITYTCKGIARLDEQGIPIVSELHKMQLRLSSDYPARQPVLRWITDIWDPNICDGPVDAGLPWESGHSLDELLLRIADMIQYKIYHALDEPPFAMDPAAAKWVREVAEPRRWIAAGGLNANWTH